MNDERLSRMETKLDKLSEAVVAMARMEERILWTILNGAVGLCSVYLR